MNPGSYYYYYIVIIVILLPLLLNNSIVINILSYIRPRALALARGLGKVSAVLGASLVWERSF